MMLATCPRQASLGSPAPLPLLLCRVEAGFPSPGGDYLAGVLDLNDLCIDDPPLPSSSCALPRARERALLRELKAEGVSINQISKRRGIVYGTARNYATQSESTQ